MKKKIIGVLGASVFFASVLAPSAFATNPYGMNYAGGEVLGGSNVQVKTDLTPLIKYGGTKQIAVSSSSHWQEGYERISDTNCRKIYYFKVSGNGQISDKNMYFTISNDQYTIKVDLKDVVLDGVTDVAADNALVISVPPHGAIAVNNGNTIYASKNAQGQCENPVSGIKQHFYRTDPGFVFVQTSINLFNKAQEKITSSNLYFGITDLDYAQSAKILNSDSVLKPGNMFASSLDVLQPTDTPLRNMYVNDGNYVYSQYGEGANEVIATNEITNIFAKVGASSQAEGLGVVFGYKTSAGSGVEYFAKQYLVKYVSDDNGTITGVSEEDIIAGNNPNGSASEPKEGYGFTNWTVDKNVTLADGTVIKAGSTITATQIKQVIVDGELVFTAHHKSVADEESEPSVAVPNTGASTSDSTGAIAATISLIGVSIGAIVIAVLPKVLHKKIGFKK